MKIIRTISDWVYKIETVLVFILVLIILGSLSAGVFYRYVVSSPLTWSDEMAMFSLAWLTFIGGSMTIRTKQAPTIDFLTEFLKGKKGRKAIIVTGYALSFVFVGYVLYLAIQWLSSPNILVQRSGSMGMPMIFTYLSIPVSFLFMTIHSLELLLESITTSEQEGT